MKKYCLTTLSVHELQSISHCYSGFSYSALSDFQNNFSAFEILQTGKVDVVYIFSGLLASEDELGGVLSANLYVTNDTLFGVDAQGDTIKIEADSEIYLFRIERINRAFIEFLKIYALKTWNIRIISSIVGDAPTLLSSKIHALAYLGTNNFPQSVVPWIGYGEDIPYLANFLRDFSQLGESIILKKDRFSGGNGIEILSRKDENLTKKLQIFIQDYLDRDYIIMQLLKTTDIEYRVYWTKENGVAKVLEVHGKRRKKGQVLHNISQGNELIKLDKNELPHKLILDIEKYCSTLSVLHGGLDVLSDKNGKYYFTENNIMTGYLCELEEKYFAQDWLNAIASCYKK